MGIGSVIWTKMEMEIEWEIGILAQECERKGISKPFPLMSSIKVEHTML